MDSTPLTTAVAPIVLVSAGPLFNGIQAKNLHLSDRMRALTAELRHPALTPDRRRQIIAQLPFFVRRIRLSQYALELLYIAILCLVGTSFLLASAFWVGALTLPLVITLTFLAGVSLLIVALGLEFVEMWTGLKTIDVEMRDAR
jgi:Protein of unknown function (DUF2721)